MLDDHQNPEAHDADADALTIVLIGPDELRRKTVAKALDISPGAQVKEIPTYPADLDDLPRLLLPLPDVVIVDLDADPEFALDIVENICAFASTTVMVYSQKADLKMAVRCMRAGAREFLNLPIVAGDIAGALARVSIRRPGARRIKRNTGKVCVFLGAKGGCGVTTLAANFAVALAQESGQKILLIDLGQPLGDAAINLGVVPEYSTANAFRDTARLDSRFLASLLTTHNSELSILAAPGEFSDAEPSIEGVNKLLEVARQSFDFVIVDVGSRMDLKNSNLFDVSSVIYLVAQVGVSELRNANRMITQYFGTRGRRLQIVLNRYLPQSLLYNEATITKALTRAAQWRIPDDYATARRTQSMATPIVLQDVPIATAIRQMARKACGLPLQEEKKRGLGFFAKLRPSPKHFHDTAEPEEI